MIADSVGLVLFAMRSSIRLGRQLRRAYVDSARRRELVLPLPNFFSTPDPGSAANYFAGPGAGFVARSGRLDALLKKRQTPGQSLTPDEEAEILTCHVEFFNLDLARHHKLGSTGEGATLNEDELNALITIRQWRRGADPDPPALQRLAGSFVEIGIDYWESAPGALNRDSRQGKIMAGFLGAMDEIKFSEVKLPELPGRMFVAALDTVSENTELLAADPKVQELVKVTAKSVCLEVARRLEEIGEGNLVKAQRVGDWADQVFRSVLSSGGGLVRSDPRRYLGVGPEGSAALVSRVAESVLGFVLDANDAGLEQLFSRQGLETILHSALVVAGEHPEILPGSRDTGLKPLLAAIATGLGRFDTALTPDLLPQLTRLILEKTRENLPLLWPDVAGAPRKHLLLTAAGTTLAILTRQPAVSARWTAPFNSAGLLSLTETVLGELAANPTWLLDDAGGLNDNLKIALETALGVIRERADKRLSPATAVAVLDGVITKVGVRKEFLDPIPGGRTLAASVLEAIFHSIFAEPLNSAAAWQLARSGTITAVVDVSFTQLARTKLGPDTVTAFTAFMKQQTASFGSGEPLDLPAFESRLREALAA